MSRSKTSTGVTVTDPLAEKVVAYGGLGATVEPLLLDQVKNLCKGCGEYRGCVLEECGVKI